jgi:ATP-dependent helicase/nuclease subunit B
MEQYMRDKSQNNIDWESVKYGDIITAVDEVTDRVVSEYKNFNMSARLKQLTKRLKHKMSRSVWAAVEQVKAGKYNPAFFELEFGKEDGLPAIVFELDNGIKIELTGKIDRIDICDANGKSYVKIVDYKSSDKGCNLSEIYAGLQLQLATYMSRLTNSKEGFFGRDKLEPGGMFYFKISDPIISTDDEKDKEKITNEQVKNYIAKGIYLSENKDNLGNNKTIESKIAVTNEEFKIILNYVDKLMEIIGKEMTEGKIQAKPYLKGKNSNNEITACKYCLYSSICKIDDKPNDMKYNVIDELPEKVALEKFKEFLNPENTEH